MKKIIVENWIRPKYLDLRMIGTWLEGTYKSYFLVYLFSGSLEKNHFKKLVFPSLLSLAFRLLGNLIENDYTRTSTVAYLKIIIRK